MNREMASSTVRHGVHIREHKNWNTKTIYNNGHVMRIYRRQPKEICFQSPMVNDLNQHLCGGWSMSDIGNEREATIDQLIMRRKPFASIIFWQTQRAEAEAGRERLQTAGLVTELRKLNWKGWNSDHVWCLLACHDIRVRDIGDLAALQKDYAQMIEADLLRNDIESFGDIHLANFFDGWDSPPLPLWLTGLLLGYPIENTISLFLE
jgi:hypothetical protein